MIKKTVAFFLMLELIICLCSCNMNPSGNIEPKQSDSSGITHSRSNLIGYVAYDDGNGELYVSMHCFLSTAEDIGINAKLYTFTTEAELTECTNQVIKDNCDAVMFYAPNLDISKYIDKIEWQDIRTIAIQTAYENASCSVTVNDCDIDVIEYLANTIGGSVLVYSSTDYDIHSVSDSLSSEAASVRIKTFKRNEYSYKEAASSLEAFLSNNPDVKSIYAVGAQNARPCMLAVNDLERKITVVGCDISDVNCNLYDDGLYALVVYPWHEMTAEAVYIMQKLSNGEKCNNSTSTIHLVTEDKVEKYIQIENSAIKWFGDES